jgi:hypothetical protein
MNKQERQRKINDNSRYLDKHDSFYGSHVDCVRINVGNTLAHEMKKLKICYDLKSQGIPFMTEAVFATGGRADVLDLLNGEVWEVQHTETEEQAREKTKKYPGVFAVNFVRSK